MRTPLRGKTVVITGAARGIGEQVARIAAERGARVGLIGLEPDRLRNLALELGPTTEWREVDVRDSDALRSALDDCATSLGGIDYLVANAGVVAYGTIRQTDDASFERVLDVNVNGVFRTLKHATPHLQNSRGHVAIIASALSFLALPSMSSYGASKAAVESLGLTYRQEVAHLGISVTLVHPSWIDTDLVRGAEADLPSFRKLRDGLPYPGNVTTSVSDAAEAIVRGLERRERRVYVPRAVAIANVAQGFVNSTLAWPWFKRFAGKSVPDVEREVDALGRQDQVRT